MRTLGSRHNIITFALFMVVALAVAGGTWTWVAHQMAESKEQDVADEAKAREKAKLAAAAKEAQATQRLAAQRKETVRDAKAVCAGTLDLADLDGQAVSMEVQTRCPDALVTPTPTPTPVAASADEASETAFVVEARDQVAQSSNVSDSNLIRFGRNICADLANSRNFYDTSFLVSDSWQAGFGEALAPVDAAALVGAAIGSLCEEFTSLLE